MSAIFMPKRYLSTNNTHEYSNKIDASEDPGTAVNISVMANGNYIGENDSRYIKGISENRSTYCHLGVEYFPNGFNGYRYWMVFTPYFRSVGINQLSKRFENSTIVMPNDGIF